MKWITEVFNRFALKTPKFFQVWQWIGIAAAAVAGLPALLVEFQTNLGITLPVWVVTISDKAVWLSGIIIWVMAKLPVKNPEQVTKTTDKLPYSEQQQ